MSVNVLVFDWLIRNYETFSLVNSWCLENKLACDWKSLSRNVIMQVVLPAAVIFQVPVQWCQWFLARKSCILVNERQCFTTTPWWSKQYCMPPMYGPRAPLGICRGFFLSRSEVHALSLTPTREQTVVNCSRDWIGFPFPLRWSWTSVFRGSQTY